MPSRNSDLRFRESRKTPQIQNWYGTDPRTRSSPEHRSVLREVRQIWTIGITSNEREVPWNAANHGIVIPWFAQWREVLWDVLSNWKVILW